MGWRGKRDRIGSILRAAAAVGTIFCPARNIVWSGAERLANILITRGSPSAGFAQISASIGLLPVFHVCSTCESSPTRDASILFPMFPVFLVVEHMTIVSPPRPSESLQLPHTTVNASIYSTHH